MSDDESNVTDLHSARKPKKQSIAQGAKNKENNVVGSRKKGKGGILHMRMADAFRFKPNIGMPRPAHDLRVFSDDNGENIIFEVGKDNVARVRKLSFVINSMVKYRRQHLEYNSDFCDWTYGDLRDCAKLWFSETEPTYKPVPFAFKGDVRDDGTPLISFHQVPFCLDLKKTYTTAEIGPTPDWDEFIGRMHNHEAAMAYLASLLIERSYLQQELYIYGLGGDGKGAMVRAFKRLFGAAAYSKQRGPRKDDKHYGVSFANKRLVAFTDSRDPAVVRADWVMALTGDDGLEVEPKGGVGYNIPPYCKLIFLSNLWPQLENIASEIRRLILCWMDPRPYGADGLVVDDPEGYEALLWAQMEPFLKQCLNVYHTHCPRHGMIPQSPEARAKVKKLTAGGEKDPFQEFFDDNFVYEQCVDGDQSFVTIPDFNARLRKEFRGTRKGEKAEFLKWLLEAYGIKGSGGVQKKIGGRNIRVIYDIAAIW